MKKQNIAKIKLFLEENQGYLKWGKERLAEKFNASIHEVIAAKNMILDEEDDEVVEPKANTRLTRASDELEDLQEFNDVTLLNKDNVLIIGDIHEPFSLDGYLEFCKEQQKKYKCGSIVFIGDVIDNHFSSYYETNTCAMGADDELDLAIKKIAKWVNAFPSAYVTIGNHDRLVSRKANTAGVSARWIKDYKDVLEAPNWKFVESIELNNVLYIHGEGSTASKKMLEEMISVVSGHKHTEGYIQYACGSRHLVFGMQVGTGIDHSKYAFAYSKHFKKPIVSCGVVLDGTQPILIPMPL